MNKDKYKAAVLLSGGLDSAVCLARAIQHLGKENVFALIIDYNQRQRIRELQAAWTLGKYYDIDYLDIEIKMPVRLNDKDALLPGRNAVFLSLACAWAEHYGAESVYFGANLDDYTNYPDCRKEFIELLNRQNKITGMNVRIVCEVAGYSKVGVLSAARQLAVPINLTWSCYNHGATPCGQCDACKLREQAEKDLDLRR